MNGEIVEGDTSEKDVRIYLAGSWKDVDVAWDTLMREGMINTVFWIFKVEREEREIEASYKG